MPFSPSAPSFSDFGLEFRPLQCHFNSSSICRKCSYSYQKERKNATTINRTRNETPSQICLLDTSGILPKLFRIAWSMKKVSALQNLIMKLFISNRIEFCQCCQLSFQSHLQAYLRRCFAPNSINFKGIISSIFARITTFSICSLWIEVTQQRLEIEFEACFRKFWNLLKKATVGNTDCYHCLFLIPCHHIFRYSSLILYLWTNTNTMGDIFSTVR